MGFAIGGLISGIVGGVEAGAAAIGTGLEALGTALVPEAAAAGAGAEAAVAAPLTAEAGLAAAAPGVVTLPTIPVVATGTELATIGPGLGAELAGGAAGLAGAGELAAAGGAATGAAFAGVPPALAALGITAADLAASGAAPGALPGGGGLLGAGPPPVPGVPGAIPGGGVTTIPETFGGPSPTTTTVTPSGGVPPTGGPVSPGEALSGVTSPLQALQQPGTFEQLWQGTQPALAAPSAPAQEAFNVLPPEAPPSPAAPSAIAAAEPVTGPGGALPSPATVSPDLGPALALQPPGGGLDTSGVPAAISQGLPEAGAFPAPNAGNLVPADVQTAINTGQLQVGGGAAGFGGVSPMVETAGLGPGGVPLSTATTPIAGVEAFNPTIGPGAPAGGAAGPVPFAGTAPGPPTPLTGGGPPGGGGIFGTGITGAQALTYGAPLAALGMLGYQALRGPAPLPPSAQQAVNQTGPGSLLYDTGQKYLHEANTGQLQPGEQAQIDQYVRDANNQLYQQIANEGVGDPRSDSRYIQGQQQIAQNAQIMSQQFITAAVTNGINLVSPSSNALTQAAQFEATANQEQAAAIGAASQAFALTAALSAGTAARQPAAPATAAA